MSSIDAYPDNETAAQCQFQAGSSATLAEHVTEIRNLRKRVLSDIIEIGRRLTECQDLVGAGNWLNWIDTEFGWSDRTALNFMRVYTMATRSEKFSDDLNLPISAFYLLAAPSTPEEVRDDVLERAKAGEVISFTDVKKEIEARKQQADAGERISGAGEHTAEDDAAVSAEKRKEQYAALDAEQDHDDDEAGETENPAAAENTATEDEAGETKVEPGTAAVADEKGEAGNPVAGADKVPALVEIMAAIDRIIELGKAPETWAFLGVSQTKTKKIGKTLRTIKVSLDELRAIIETPSKKPRPAADEAA